MQVAHNRRVNGVTQAEALVNLGREELDLDGLRRLAASTARYGDGDGAGEPLGAPGEFDVVASRPLGGHGCWMGCGACWASIARRGRAGKRRFSTYVERVVFALVAKTRARAGVQARRRGVEV